MQVLAGESTAGVRMDAINAENMREYFDLLRSVWRVWFCTIRTALLATNVVLSAIVLSARVSYCGVK